MKQHIDLFFLLANPNKDIISSLALALCWPQPKACYGSIVNWISVLAGSFPAVLFNFCIATVCFFIDVANLYIPFVMACG